MEPIKTIRNSGILQREYFKRIGDLINIEGPMLSLFEDTNNHNLYLYDWVDSDQNINRWLVYQILPSDLFDYISKDISHLDLYNLAVGGIYYCADINSRKQIGQYDIFKLKNVPEAYLPIQGQFFNEDNCSTVEDLILFVSRANARKQKSNTYDKSMTPIISEMEKSGIYIEDSYGLDISQNTRAEEEINKLDKLSFWATTHGVYIDNSYEGNIKNQQAHVRQTYELPQRERVEISAEQ